MRVRLTADEKKAFTRFVESIGQKPSIVLRRMVREAITGEPDLFDDDLTSLTHATNELAAVGRNLNQIARAINRRDILTDGVSEDDLARVTASVSTLKAEIRRIVKNTKTRSLHVTRMTGSNRAGE